MNPRISFKTYQRRFLKPLRTAQGEWSLREGIIVRMEQQERIDYGEVAPIADFGSETLSAAREWLQRCGPGAGWPESAEWAQLPCCGFALSAADLPAAALRTYAVAGLLPAGAAVLARAVAQVAAGFRVLKWKIGVEPLARELELLGQLMQQLPPQVRLRLDANGGLCPAELTLWLAALAAYGARVEYLEQPLPVGQEPEMARQMQASGVAIALDESLNGPLAHFWLADWSGPLVVKPALMGRLPEQVERLRPVAARVVLSSVFETRIGLEGALRLADQLPHLNYAIGFDTGAAFDDGLGLASIGPQIEPATRTMYDPEKIWNQLPPLN
jgi:O-succinylbenzoate synthase